MVDPALLRSVPLFASLAVQDLEQLVGDLRRRRYARGQIVVAAGDPGDNLYLIESGRVKLAFTSPEGREVILDVMGPTDFFGELALLDGEPRSADAIAMEASVLCLLGRNEFLNFLEQRPHVAIMLLGVLSQRLRRDARLLQDAAFLDVPARLARTILRLAEPGADGVARTPRLTQTDLAGIAGTTRETLNKWLGFYEDEGLIRREGGIIAVVDAERLGRRVN
jgi:CRP/FNR family transcriptional regulator, cyclic AMP receptor protein